MDANTQTSAPAQQTQAPKVKTFAIAEKAAAQIVRLRQTRGTPEAGLRLAVKGGGCSGLTYVLEWAEQPRERDKIFEEHGARVFIDSKSYLYLMGSELAWKETLMQSGFEIQNPKVKAACGCGESFTI